jgi:hypothetical protein
MRVRYLGTKVFKLRAIRTMIRYERDAKSCFISDRDVHAAAVGAFESNSSEALAIRHRIIG